MKRSPYDSAVIASGLLTSIATAYILSWIQRSTGFAFHAYTFWILIPAGAIVSGWAAASGYLITAKLLRYRPSPSILPVIFLVAIGTYILIYYFLYASLQVRGQPLSDIISFPAFWQASLLNMKVNLMGAYRTGSIGVLGYLQAALAMGGFVLAASHLYGYTRSIPYCDACSERVSQAGYARRYSGLPGEMEKAAYAAFANAENGSSEQAIRGFDKLGEQQPTAENPFRSTLTIWKCPQCAGQIVDVKCHQKGGPIWTEMKELHFVKLVSGAFAQRSIAR